MTDRPWGLTLGAIALRRHTGQLTVDSDGKRYCIAFENGAVVAAISPQAADAIARIALTNHFITSTQVSELSRRLAAAPERDEVEVLAEAIRFTPDQALKLRHRLVAQRAARTFSLERGDFVLDDRIALPTYPGVAVDHRHVIYLGVRTNLAEQRLIDDLRQLGSYFVLKPEAIDELPRFGFEAAAQPVIDALKLGTSLPELEASHRELDPRFAQAIIYALVSCSACVIPPRTATQTAAARTQTPTSSARTQTPRNVTPRASSRALREAASGDTERNPPQRLATEGDTERHPPQRLPAENAPDRPAAGTAPPLAIGTATYDGLGDERTPAPTSGNRTATPTGTPSAVRTTTPPSSPSAARTTTPPADGRTTTPPLGRTMTSPFASRTATKSPSSYASAAPQDAGTNTPAATRPRTAGDTQPDLRSTPAPAGRAPATTPPGALPTATPRTLTPRPMPGTGGPPIPARTTTEDSGKFVDMPTPSPLPGAAKAPGAASFGEPQPTRAATAGQSGTRPAVPRAMTPSDTEFRGFGDQRTPSGFPEQRTPGFGEQRTPANQRTPTDPAGSRTPTGSPVTSRVSTDNAAAAEEAFKRGELAMKRDQPGEAILEFKTACDLNPGEVDYAGMLAWAKFCAAGDKAAIGADTRKALERAVYRSNKPERARFYLGRVERMLGRDREALRHFQEVLDLKPNHAEAASEVRAIEARLQGGGKTGLFGRKR